MTLQIACVGSDGVLLASDTCMAEQVHVRTTTSTSKIVEKPEHKVFYAYAGDDWARETGKEFERHLASGFCLEKIRDGLETIGDQWCRAEMERLKSRHGVFSLHVDRRLTVVFYGLKEPQLWQLKISEQSRATQCFDKVVAGDSGNSAVFFSENYYSAPDSRPSLEYLKRLAAHVILMGRERNSELVQGLEMVTYRFGDNAPIHVGDKELGKLRHFSQELDSYIRRRFGQAT